METINNGAKYIALGKVLVDVRDIEDIKVIGRAATGQTVHGIKFTDGTMVQHAMTDIMLSMYEDLKKKVAEQTKAPEENLSV